VTAEPHSWDVVVVGDGIAGLGAASFTARLGWSTLLVTGGVPGGLLLSIERIEGIPGFPDGLPGYDLVPGAQDEAGANGVEFRLAEATAVEPVDGLWRVVAGGELQARAVILATGARLRHLGVPGEEPFRGKGVSHCASCDAPLFRDQVVAVVGGGDSACQEALTLADAVSEVVLLVRGAGLSAQASYRKRIGEHTRITLRPSTAVVEIQGDGKVASVRARRLDTGAEEEIPVAGVFVYVGLEPSSELVSDLLPLDAAGRVPTDASMRTQRAGLCAAGIVRAGTSGQAAGSMGDAVTAAVTLDHYLRQGTWA
jgi:thioredoxin reductase (NADPH)